MNLTLQKLREEFKAVRKRNPKVAQRLQALIELEKINLEFKSIPYKSGKRLKVLALCQGLEYSERTLFRWRRAYIQRGLFGLLKKHKSGRKKTPLPTEVKVIIEQMRKHYRWGSEVIQAHLKYDHQIELSRYKIDRYLDESGLRKEYPCQTIKTRRKTKKKHNKKVKVSTPGAHTQIDVNHQPHLVEDQKSYVYNFVDHASNWSFKRAYKSASSKSTADFIKRLVKACPFTIYRLQTDNGTEFTYKYISKHFDAPKKHKLTSLCQKYQINHRLIPPGEKELQGLVERSHRQDSQELFLRIRPSSLGCFNGHLGYYQVERNNGRRFKKLDWKTPNEWLSMFTIVTVAICLYWKDKGKNVKLGNPKDLPQQVAVIKGVLSKRNKKKKVA